MSKIPVHNNTAMAMYVAGQMIPAGETLHFDIEQVPPHLRPAPAVAEEETVPVDRVAELAAGAVAAAVAAIPDLSDEDLERLGELEQAKGDKARKTLLEPIAAAILSRAASA